MVRGKRKAVRKRNSREKKFIRSLSPTLCTRQTSIDDFVNGGRAPPPPPPPAYKLIVDWSAILKMADRLMIHFVCWPLIRTSSSPIYEIVHCNSTIVSFFLTPAWFFFFSCQVPRVIYSPSLLEPCLFVPPHSLDIVYKEIYSHNRENFFEQQCT